MKLEAQARKKKIEDSQLLIPKSLREKKAAAVRRRYKATVLRVQLPDGLILQGYFGAKESTTALYEVSFALVSQRWFVLILTDELSSHVKCQCLNS